MSQPRPPSKHAKELAAWAAKRGWTCDFSGRKHLRFEKPGCPPVFCSRTPSDSHATKNAQRTFIRVEKEALGK